MNTPYVELNPDKNTTLYRFKVISMSDHHYNVVVPGWQECLEWVRENFNTERGVRSIERKRGTVQVPK